MSDKHSLLAKMFAIQNSGLKFKKDGVNPHFKSAYMTLDGIMEVLQPALEKQNLCVGHRIVSGVLLTSVADIESGSTLDSEFKLPDLDPQKVGSAITYGKRYNLGCLFNITVDEDDDGNATAPKSAANYQDKPPFGKGSEDDFIN